MLKISRWTRVLLVSLPLVTPGCITPGAPAEIHYYSPTLPSAASKARSRSERPLWLRRVVSAGHLGQRFVWRASDVEYGFRELTRWTEEPSTFVRQALERQIFPGVFQRNETSRALSLEIELLAFEEQFIPERRAHVAFVVRLQDADGKNLLERSVEHLTPIEGSGYAAVARAMGLSLSVATREAVRLIDHAAP
ncbi:MAG: putative lipoprotein YmbA [Chlamydiales bacterium]|jgi:uncharacterized lipoprotein YmbA